MSQQSLQEELERRVAKLQNELSENQIEGALILNNAALYYFSGTIQRSYLYIPVKGLPVLMVIKDFHRARVESPLQHVVELKSFRDMPKILLEYGIKPISALGVEMDVVPADQYFRIEKVFQPDQMSDIAPFVRKIRMIKSTSEQNKIRQAGRHAARVMKMVYESMRPGMSEFTLVGMIEAFSRELGHAGYIRARAMNQELTYVQLLSGPDGSEISFGNGPLGGKGPHDAYPHGPSNRTIQAHEPIILDYEAWYDGYMADMTRTFAIDSLPAHLMEAYQVAATIEEQIQEIIHPGVPSGEIYRMASEMASEAGLQEHFMGMRKPVPFVGHGLGLEVDEWPVLFSGNTTKLEAGMVLAAEPKFVFPEGAVGIENTYLVTDNGCEVLTPFDQRLMISGDSV